MFPADSQLVMVAQRISKSFAYSRRYIDDLSALNNPYLRHLLYRDVVFQGM